jgi:hypothetical protein
MVAGRRQDLPVAEVAPVALPARHADASHQQGPTHRTSRDRVNRGGHEQDMPAAFLCSPFGLTLRCIGSPAAADPRSRGNMDSVTVAHDYDDLRHLVDRLTGPLVVAIDRSDKQHARCAAWLESPNAAFLTQSPPASPSVSPSRSATGSRPPRPTNPTAGNIVPGIDPPPIMKAS